MGQISAPWAHKKINGDHYYLWRDLIKPGDVLLSDTDGELSNIFNPSGINHGALYLGGDKIKYVIEAIGEGVTESNLVKFLTTKDRVVILRPRFFSPEKEGLLIEAAAYYNGLPYDYEFQQDDTEYYCFELIINIFKALYPDKVFPCKRVFGQNIYDSDTFVYDPRDWELILDSDKELGNEED